MLIFGLLLLLLLIAVTLRRDMSILFSRITIIILLYCLIIALYSLNLNYLEKGIGLYGGLFHCTSNTHIFQIFIFILSTIILQLTAFYPRKIWLKEFSSLYIIIRYKYIYSATNIINKMGQQYKIMEYPLIILFVITGAIFFLSTSNLLSVFFYIKYFIFIYIINKLKNILKNKLISYFLYFFKLAKNFDLENFSLLIYYNLININIINYLFLGVTFLICTFLADIWFIQALLCLTSIVCIYFCLLSIIYINYINKEFKNKYPVICNIISFICLILIVISLIILFILIYIMLYDIKNYILKMFSANNHPKSTSNPNSSNGNQQSNRPEGGPPHNRWNPYSSANDREEERKKRLYEEQKQQYNQWKRQEEERQRCMEEERQQYLERKREQYRKWVWENSSPARKKEIWDYYETVIPQGKNTYKEWLEFHNMTNRWLNREIKNEKEKCNIYW